MADGDCWYGHVLSTEHGHCLRRVLAFEVEVNGGEEC